MIDEFGALALFLQTNPADVGCDQAMQMLHVYVELLASGDADLPGVAAHLAACAPCAEDFDGLLASVRAHN